MFAQRFIYNKISNIERLLMNALYEKQIDDNGSFDIVIMYMGHMKWNFEHGMTERFEDFYITCSHILTQVLENFNKS